MKNYLLLFFLIFLYTQLFGHDVFIVNSNDETLSRYDTETSMLDNHILQLGLYANQIVIHEDKAYVVNSGVHNIQIIDLETVSTIGYINCPNGSNPYWMVIHPDGDKAYVTALFTNSVYVLDLVNNNVSNTITVGPVPEGMVLFNNNLYVMNSSYGSSTGTVSVINTNTETVTNTIPVGNNPQFGSVDALGHLHVVCTGNYGYVSPAVWGKIYVINTSNYNEITILDIGGSPLKIGIHPNGTAYLADSFGLGYMAYNSLNLSITHSSTELWASGGNFIQFDETGAMYLGDPLDWINNGKVYIYSETEELLNTLTVGVNPQDAGFYYPGVGVDVQPQETITAGNFPNPFSNSTTISFSLTTRLLRQSADTSRQAEIEIFNIKGQKVKELTSFLNPCLGTHKVTWDGSDDYNNQVPGGVYLYKIIANGVETAFHKMILLR